MIHRVKVTFKNEPGEGSGVTRSFFTAIGNAFMSADKLPKLDNLTTNSTSKLNNFKLHYCSVLSTVYVMEYFKIKG